MNTTRFKILKLLVFFLTPEGLKNLLEHTLLFPNVEDWLDARWFFEDEVLVERERLQKVIEVIKKWIRRWGNAY